MAPTKKILDKVICINLDVHVWSGTRQLKKEDLADIPSDAMPPSAIASLGSKKTVDPNELREFRRLYRQAERTLSNIGVRFLGGYAIPIDRLDEVTQELDSIQAAYINEKQRLLNDFNDLVEQWIGKHPEWESVIRSAVPERARVNNAISFDWQAYRVVPTQEVTGSEQGLEREAESLSARLFEEIAATADKIWNQSFKGTWEVSQRRLNSLRGMHEKLKGLVFINPAIAPVADSLEETLSVMPKSGPISGADFDRLNSLVMLMTDPQRLESHGRGLIQGASGSDSESGESDESEEEELNELNNWHKPADQTLIQPPEWF